MLDKYIKRENEYISKLENIQGQLGCISGIGLASLGITSIVSIAYYLVAGEHLTDTSSLCKTIMGIEALVTLVPIIPIRILESFADDSNKRINRRQRDIFGI